MKTQITLSINDLSYIWMHERPARFPNKPGNNPSNQALKELQQTLFYKDFIPSFIEEHTGIEIETFYQEDHRYITLSYRGRVQEMISQFRFFWNYYNHNIPEPSEEDDFKIFYLRPIDALFDYLER